MQAGVGMRADSWQRFAGLGRAWGWVLFFGVLTLAVGLAAIVWPGRTVVVIAVLFGVQLLVWGVFRLIQALALGEASGGARVLYALIGILSIIVGMLCLRHVLQTIAVLVLLLGVYWLVSGVVETWTALAHSDLPHRGMSIVMGVLGLIAGIVVLAAPGISLLTLTIVLGCWLMLLGISEVVAALRLRRLKEMSGNHRDYGGVQPA